EKSFSNKNLHTILADVTDYQALEKSLKSLTVDILVNNAGIWLEGGLETQTDKQIADTIDVNFKGTIYATRVVLPQMKKRNSGFILNVSSTSGLKGRENQVVYAATKWGVRGFTVSLEEELIKTGIKVAGFYPGGMNTEIFAKAGNTSDHSTWMDTDKVAEIIVFMLEHSDNMRINSLQVNRK
ncbi:MAG TPA: SDR family NAD(P)-dependent oxidoreductase, partial [Candidatus Saccharimonadales bacterium]|nr:SDR family NAD(P)-dependent oxidoreductase [Candidatus Saccharimonadales bacterium]